MNKLVQQISSSSDTLISIGLLEAEMTKHSKNIVFSNSEPIVINHILDWFEKNFKIPRNNWRWLIQFNKKLVNHEAPKEMKSRELAAYLFWIKNTQIDKNKHFPKWVTYRGFDKGVLSTESKWGMLSIYCGNNKIQKIINSLLNRTFSSLSKLSENKIINYLDGLFCGDGGVNLSRSVRRIFVASFRKEVKNQLMDLFTKLRIDAYISGNEIFISNLTDLFRLYKNNFFYTHPLKRLQLVELLLSYKQFQGKAKNIRNELLKRKANLKEEHKKLSNFTNNRTNLFNNLLGFCQNKIKQTTEFPMEINLTGLARKPNRFIISKIVYAKPGITHRDIIKKTSFSYSSVKHITQRLSKEKYLRKEYFQPFNQVKLFPTNKLLKEINFAKLLRSDFENRYKISEEIKNVF